MTVTCVMVASLDGLTTQGNSPGTAGWSSPEDQEVFHDLIARADCMIMGSNTYRAARSLMNPSAAKPRIILTRSPEEYAEDAGKPGLTFTARSPQNIMHDLQTAGYENVLLVGGSTTNASFFDAGLVDELVLTIEPLLFGDGLPLTGRLKRSVALRLMERKQLNDAGTLLLRYKVLKSE